MLLVVVLAMVICSDLSIVCVPVCKCHEQNVVVLLKTSVVHSVSSCMLQDIREGLLLSFAFHDLRFCLSSQLKAASCARCSSEMPPSKQVNGHSFTTCLIVWGSPHSQSGEAI